jgi:glutamine amidotransferase
LSVSILDYGCGNVYNVKRALSYIGIDKPKVVTSLDDILHSDKLILPGVGSFPHAMEIMNQNNIVNHLNEYVDSGKLLIGICLGMQLLFDCSDEIVNTKGLGFINGEIKSLENIKKNSKEKIPHVGWSKTHFHNIDEINYNNEMSESNWLYYNHSFFANPSNPNDCIATSKFGNEIFCAAAKKDNVIGFQFHPERSAEHGLSLLKFFLMN